MIEGNIPLISATADNNGIIGYYTSDTRIFPRNTITVDMFGHAFVQSKRYQTVSHGRVNVFLPKKTNLNFNSLLFMASVINKVTKQHDYGYKTMLTRSKSLKLMIKLPVDSNGDPDWQYMDTYIAKLTTLAHKNVSSLKKTKAKPAKLNIDHWGEFKASDLFDFDHGKRLTKKDRIPGKIPFCTAGAENQGIVDHLSGDFVIWHKPITIDMFGNTFYHNFDCAGDDNIYALINNDLSKTSKIFIVSVLNRQLKQKFSFKDQFRQSDLDHLIIKLPIDANGEPDWEYMDTRVRHFATLSNLTIASLRSVV